MNKFTTAFIFAFFSIVSFSQELKWETRSPSENHSYPASADTADLFDPVTSAVIRLDVKEEAVPRIPYRAFQSPALEKVYVRLGNTKSDKVKIRLRDSKGELLSSEEQRISPDQTIELNSKLSRGIYFISVTDQNYSVTKKIVIE